MNSWDRRYTDRVQLLVELLPLLAGEPGFALKGGTAINLFEHDLPRLSVDIDLTWLPVHDYARDVPRPCRVSGASCRTWPLAPSASERKIFATCSRPWRGSDKSGGRRRQQAGTYGGMGFAKRFA